MLCTIPLTLFSQSSNDSLSPEKKRLISKVEIFAGPNLSFNHGNKFIENYNDENVTNKRLMKVDYLFGIGAVHPISKRIDINVRFQYEQKGTKNKLSTPALPDGRIVSLDNYSYRYLTLLATPQITIGRKMNFVLSVGGYYSKIKKVNGTTKISDTSGNVNSEGSFEGRYFYDLADDGIRQGLAWMPYLNSIENNDFGLVTSIGYKIPFKKKHSVLIQLQDNLGLKNTNKNNPYGLKERNHSLSLIISYTYHLPPKSLSL